MTMQDDIARLAHLGRGGQHLIFNETTVVKRAHTLMEPLIIKAFPQVFIPIISMAPEAGDPSFVMPRMFPATLERRRTALMAGSDKLKLLWQQPNSDTAHGWRGRLYAHLQRVQHRFPQHVPKNIGRLAQDVPEPVRHVHIHGDATLANLVHNEHDEWFWIDPLWREFIPGDPHVDLGKMLQSCGGYEEVLLGSDAPRGDKELAKQLARHCNLDLNVGLLWLKIHIVRLIPYQEPRVQQYYGEVLRRMGL